jgi:hypothetical protein
MPDVVEVFDQFTKGKRTRRGQRIPNPPLPVVTLVAPAKIDAVIGARDRGSATRTCGSCGTRASSFMIATVSSSRSVDTRSSAHTRSLAARPRYRGSGASRGRRRDRRAGSARSSRSRRPRGMAPARTLSKLGGTRGSPGSQASAFRALRQRAWVAGRPVSELNPAYR